MNLILINVLIIIFLLTFFVWFMNNQHTEFIQGTWMGNSDFLNESELDDAFAIIKEDQLALTLISGNSEVENSISTFSLSQLPKSYFSNIKEYVISVDNSDLLPESLFLVLDKESGSIILKDNEKIYMSLIKTFDI